MNNRNEIYSWLRSIEEPQNLPQNEHVDLEHDVYEILDEFTKTADDLDFLIEHFAGSDSSIIVAVLAGLVMRRRYLEDFGDVSPLLFKLIASLQRTNHPGTLIALLSSLMAELDIKKTLPEGSGSADVLGAAISYRGKQERNVLAAALEVLDRAKNLRLLGAFVQRGQKQAIVRRLQEIGRVGPPEDRQVAGKLLPSIAQL